MVEDGIFLTPEATLQEAMPLFDKAGVPFIPVVGDAEEDGQRPVHGALFHVDALKTFNRALAATAAEEHS
jgi:CIC family chloride channel protein